MVAGGEHCQLRAAIEVLVPYTYAGRLEEALARRRFFLRERGPRCGYPHRAAGSCISGRAFTGTITSRRLLA
jgi:hypothetical protein